MKVFLTGEKQVGKSTIIESVLKNYGGTVGGFVTKKLTDPACGVQNIYIFDYNDAKKVVDNKYAVGRCGQTCIEAFYPQVFDDAGTKALTKKPTPKLLVMDELGSIEDEAQIFKQTVLNVLSKQIHVLGVLQSKSTAFLDAIRQTEGVLVMEVTPQNRAALIEELVAMLKKATKKARH